METSREVMPQYAPEPQLEELVRRTEGLQPWRRLFHLVGGSCLAWVVYALSPEAPRTRWLFAIMLGLALVGDLLRLAYVTFNRYAYRTFGALMCPREVRRPSLTWFMLGVFLALWLPDPELAVPSLLVLAIADPAASVVGRVWGKYPLGEGTWEGTLAFFVAALLVLVPYAGIVAALPVAALAAAAEGLTTPVDDNVVIPVVTGCGLWVVSGLG
jgi:dolichol kinase